MRIRQHRAAAAAGWWVLATGLLLGVYSERGSRFFGHATHALPRIGGSGDAAAVGAPRPWGAVAAAVPASAQEVAARSKRAGDVEDTGEENESGGGEAGEGGNAGGAGDGGGAGDDGGAGDYRGAGGAGDGGGAGDDGGAGGAGDGGGTGDDGGAGDADDEGGGGEGGEDGDGGDDSSPPVESTVAPTEAPAVCDPAPCQAAVAADPKAYTGECEFADDGETSRCVCRENFGNSADDPLECLPDDLCESNPCPEHATCHPGHGEYICECDTGYMPVTGRKLAVRERGSHGNGSGNGSGDGNGNGGNGNGGTNDGGAGDGGTDDGGADDGTTVVACEDVDECAAYPGLCGDRGTCRNLEGSFACDCEEGFTENPELPPYAERLETMCAECCVDVDECAEYSDMCGDQGVCRNTVGSFACDCGDGYRAPSTLPPYAEMVNTRCKECCVDMDECAEQPSMCAGRGECRNTPGSFTCECFTGFRENPADIPYQDRMQTLCSECCLDVDECAETPGLCADQGACVNTPGSFSCECFDGYRKNDTELSYEERLDSLCQSCCYDIDECAENSLMCVGQGECRNTVGSFACDCAAGYRENPAEIPYAERVGSLCRECCLDIDECAENPGMCVDQGVCHNLPGTFTCDCLDGFRKNETEASYEERLDSLCKECCFDIDECEENPKMCVEQGECRNTHGSFACDCFQGFRENEDPGSYSYRVLTQCQNCCLDIDECLENPGMCVNQGLCHNLPGSFNCDCLDGFRANETLPPYEERLETLCRDCCPDVDECAENPSMCVNQGVCKNAVGSFRCDCFGGYREGGSSLSYADRVSSLCRECCEDIDECAEEKDVCSDGCASGLVDPPYNYTCSCSDNRYSDPDEVDFRRCKNCEYGDWGEFGSCNVTCGSGYAFRYRAAVTKHSMCKNSPGTTDRQACVVMNCDESRCVLSPWGGWSDCHNSAQTRRRFVVEHAELCDADVELEQSRWCESNEGVLTFLNPTQMGLAAAGGGVVVIVSTVCAVYACKRRRSLRRRPSDLLGQYGQYDFTD